MSTPRPAPRLSKEQLQAAINEESKKFEAFYLWIEQHMPGSFFEEVDKESIRLIVHSLMGFDFNDYFTLIHSKTTSFTLCLDSPDADLRILKQWQSYGIKNYRAFVSNAPPPFSEIKTHLRIAVITLADFSEIPTTPAAAPEKEKEIIAALKERNPEVTESGFQKLLAQLGSKFVRSLTKDRLVLALDMFFRAKTRDNCQYEVRYNEDWKEKKETPSMQIVLAWRNVQKYNFLYRLAKVIHRHGLTMKKVNATYLDPYSRQNILIMSIGIHGSKGGAAWEEADINDFLKELVTLKYFQGMELVEEVFVDTKLLSGNLGNLIKSIVYFVHQVLVHADLNMYSLNHVEEGICRHPELIVHLAKAFEAKFNPDHPNESEFHKAKDHFLNLVEHLDTGNEINDTRRKNILRQAMNFVEHTLKTNFYRNNKTAFSFRLDPHYLDHVPYDRKEKFPELPYAIFFMKGMCYLGFHIRFRDLSRGGLRTVLPERIEQMIAERNNVFSEAYNLAYTQNKKNKDIPEGGAKGVIFLEPYGRLYSEEEILQKELEETGAATEEIAQKIKAFHTEQKLEYLHQTQRSFIESFVTLVNCDPDGKLRAKHIVDYYKKPEYIYLGPDENMHNNMIEWIAAYSKLFNYKPGGAFISSKPGAGINHKEYGVTSLGVNVYMEEVLKYLGFDPAKDPFSIKMTGGPDGDVAGNQIFNLYQFYPKTAQLRALIDGSGTIYDPIGLDLEQLSELFKEGKPIRFYPPQKLNEGGFLLDTRTKREQSAYAQQTLCSRKKEGKVVEEWLSGNEMNHLLRHNVHETLTDIFIPAGGRPRTLSESNLKDFLDENGKPSSKAIVEGANLYLTPWARRALEKLGVLIFKDSSANKGGVICSSFEVLFSLVLSEEEFLKEKVQIVEEILEIIRTKARMEAQLLLKTHSEQGAHLTEISEWISERINVYKDQLMAYLHTVTLSNDPKDPLIRCLLNYCPPLLRNHYLKRILDEVPDVHKKAIIACHLASRVVYFRGLSWTPSLVDVLPIITKDPLIVGNFILE
ncbi:MAG: NAD-glutamate dehydrogenase [Rhabdochlamydiaceae bacterium]|nr:NAD-glutamate dehydrogenase [Rhabdochlamydiaceae bacterium]